MSVRIIQGDVREEMPKLPADYFDCIVTSPPYYGLRDYGTARWEGGDPSCEHKLVRPQGPSTLNSRCGQAQIDYAAKIEEQYRLKCGKCGARRIDSQIGLEPTLDAYLETMVAVCRELRRVLKPSGVFFLNCGDSYAAGQKGSGGGPAKSGLRRDGRREEVRIAGAEAANARARFEARKFNLGDLKPKDLCLVPERLGIALQADGWWVRSHIIWAKPNPMPESVTDRPTNAHETIWMLTKNSRYFWDGEAVAEDATCTNGGLRFTAVQSDAVSVNVHGNQLPENYRKQRGQTRNIRNVWSVASHSFSGAHFATMPPEIAERCIKAGSSERGCCPECGAPWVRVVEYGKPNLDTPQRGSQPYSMAIGGTHRDGKRIGDYAGMPIRTSKTIGWEPSCKCPPADSVPSRILDPFAGAGTTGLVADRLGRDATLIDLNTSYIDMAVNRIRGDAPLFAEVAAE